MAWQTVFFTASILAACSMIAFALLLGLVLPSESEVTSEENVKDDTKVKATSHNDENILAILKRSGVVTVFACIIVCGFLRDGIESWLPTLYSEAFNRDVSESTLLSIILPIFSIMSISVVTALHKRKTFNNEVIGAAILFGGALLCAIPLAFFVQMEGRVFGVISLLLTALICGAMHGVNFLLISCLPGRFASIGRSATVSGVCNSCVYIGAAISTYGIALVSELMGWSLTIISWCAILMLGITFAGLSYKKYSAMLKAEKE
jgi:sugar phosphate permease